MSIVFEGDQKMLFEESMKDMATAMVLSFIFVYLIRVAIFESFLLPLTIWLSVPMAMVGALLALALGLSTGSELRRGMSIALIGGLIFSTALTLFLVPVIYTLLERLKEWVGAG